MPSNCACVYICLQYPTVFKSSFAHPGLQDKVQSVAEYAPEIADQLFHDEAIFMPRADYMEPRPRFDRLDLVSASSAVETTAVDV